MAEEANDVGMSADKVPAIFGMRFFCLLALIQNRILAKMEILLNILDENRIKIKRKIPLFVQIHSSTPRTLHSIRSRFKSNGRLEEIDGASVATFAFIPRLFEELFSSY